MSRHLSLPKYYISLVFISFLSTKALAVGNCSIPEHLSGHIILDSKCSYDGNIVITESNTTLNCNNAMINSSGFKDGIVISSEGKDTNNIKIKNCTIINAEDSGVRVSWLGKDTSKTGLPDRYLRTPHNITLDNLKIFNSGKNGIFIDDYSSLVTITNSTIKNSGATAIYIEHDSKKNIIENNFFGNNGFKNGRPSREAIAIDSSQKNTIIGNIFESNGKGGVFVYKNCSEKIHSGNQEIRKMHADFNIIRDNVFINKKIGVWLASRQGKNLKNMDCGDESIDGAGMYYKDFADNNLVTNNTFNVVGKPIIDNGKDNRIIDNIIK
ncbi:hypothetical protein DXF93_02390 [Escherichia coli]|nr:hypothetical protein DXF93_02390 [Escherichia coli]